LGQGFESHLLNNPVVKLEGKNIAVFICYEQFLVFPVLHSLLYKPSALIGMSNMWWSRKDLSIIQRGIMQAWGRLFGIPVVLSTNR
jgi:apolipoprotein N-acyltransferase